MSKTAYQKPSKRILVYRVGELGDTLISLPALWAIRAYFPNGHLALLSNVDYKSNNVGAQQVLPPGGLIDEWLSYPSTDLKTDPLNLIPLLVRLRRLAFDTLVYLAPRIRKPEAIRRDLLFFRLAGIRNVIGHLGFEPLPGKNGKGTLPKVEHEADHLLRRLSLSGVPTPPGGTARIDLDLTEAEVKHGHTWLADHVTGYPDKVMLVGFGPGSKWPSKIWPEEKFAALGRKLIGETQAVPVVFGAREDAPLARRMIQAWGRGVNAAGELTVREAAAALSRCALYVGNDTGTMHLAAAVEIPCVAIMAAIDWPGHWSPYGSGHIVLRRDVECEGCLLKVCFAEGMRCLREIEVEEVFSACKQVLERTLPQRAQQASASSLI